MTDEDVLAELRDHLKAERRDDAAAEALARGDVDAPEAKALLARAESGDEEAKALAAASRPLGEGVEERVVARIAKKGGSASASASAPASASASASATASAPASASASASASAPASASASASAPASASASVSLLRRAFTLGAPLALAAALVLYVATRPATGGGPSLPEYALSATGEQTMRGDAPPSATELRAGADSAKFEIVARPATQAGTRVAAWAFVMGAGDAEPSPLEAKIEVAPEGGVRITGAGRALRDAREIRVVVAPAETIAKYDEALSRAKVAKSDAHVRVLVVAIRR